MAARKRLSDRDVRWIRNVGVRTTLAKAARIVGCSPQHVSDIIKRKRRASVPDSV